MNKNWLLPVPVHIFLTLTLKKEMKNHPCGFKLADVQSWHMELENS